MFTPPGFPQFYLDQFQADFSEPIENLSSPHFEMQLGEEPPTKTLLRKAIREGGFKPSGRNKPAWEYLRSAFEKGSFPQINAPVDVANQNSARFGLAISLVDRALVSGKIELRLGESEESYVFNPSGQVLEAAGLIGLADDQGLFATPIKDCQRTKTSSETRSFLVVVWGLTEESERSEACSDKLRKDLSALGATIREFSSTISA